MSWPLLIALGAVAATWLRWRYRNRRMLAMAQKMPGPAPLPMLGNALKFMCQPEEFIRVVKTLMQEYGDVVRFWLGPDLNVLVSNPDDLKVLLTNMKTSFKGPQYKYMADLLGGGILSGSGPSWRKHRKIANPNYGKRAIEAYGQVFNEEVDVLLDSFRTKTGRQIDVYKYIVQTTSHAVCRRGYLERTLIGTKGSIERTKEKLDKMCTYRTLWPNFFTEYYPREEAKQYGDDVQMALLPKLTEEHYRVLLLKSRLKTFKPTFVVDAFRYAFGYLEYAKAHDYANGYIFYLDFSELDMAELISVLNINELRKCSTIVLGGYDARAVGIHVWSTSMLIEVGVKIAKQILSAKLSDRIHIHTKLESIYDFIPKAILPVEYGGEEKSIMTLYGTLMGLSKEQTMKLPYLQDVIDDSPSVYDIVFKRMTKWYLQIDPVFWLSSFHQAQKSFMVKMTEFSKTIIDYRTDHLNMLGDQNKIELMNSEEDSSTNTQLSVIDRFILSQELNDQEIVDETFTIFTSSQEATAKISSFTLLMMAYHPQCQEKLYAEVKSVIGDEDRPVTDEDLKKMPYLDMVFREVVRLFPIGALLQRSIHEDIVISSGTLPAGSSLVIPIYHLHRDPRYWSRPDDFDPERFSPENTKKRHPNCYIPFSLGPMDCLGRFFGTKLVKTVCARVLRDFKVTSPGTYKDLKLAIAVSVISVDGFKAILTPRTAN